MVKDDFILNLSATRKTSSLPDKLAANKFITDLLGVLFPSFGNNTLKDEESIQNELELLKVHLAILLSPLADNLDKDTKSLSEDFFKRLPEIYRLLKLDAEAMYLGDPAARSVDEVILAYPGFFAIAVYRFAHTLHLLNVPILPRIISEYAHCRTGVDIHPAAQIGERFCIDHATGVVIGETTIIGNNVKLYQGVTLGAPSVSKDMAKQKRHPTIKDNVVIYANATILGGDTVIGENTIIGGNVWITSSIPANSTVYQKSEVTVRTDSNS